MSTAHALREAVATAASGTIGALQADFLTKLQSAAAEFVMAPDPYVDVSRLPPGVSDLDTLFIELRNTQRAITENKVAAEKEGKVRSYKLYVCAIHAIASYVGGNPRPTGTYNEVAMATMRHAADNAPPGMSSGGRTLWEKTFTTDSARTKAVVISVYFLGRVITAPGSGSGM